ncbi:MAG TPA: hypothetical protein VF701_08595 [Thermoanaerobaculia bacterium]
MVSALVLFAVCCSPSARERETALEAVEAERRIAALERRIEQLEKPEKPETTTVAEKISLTAPSVTKSAAAPAVEREQGFTAEIRNLRVTEATTVRCRYDWDVHIFNAAPERRGFSGHVAFKDANGYVIAKNEMPMHRPLRVQPIGEETYVQFLYVAPEHARLIKTAEVSVFALSLSGRESPSAVSREWHGIWPQ